MKNRICFIIIGVFGIFLTTCGSTPQTPKGAYYEGNGGKGISLAILAPKATSLDESQVYIPTLVQGEFVSNFSTYTAISVMDRVNLDNVYAELLSGYYDDNDKAGLDLGHLKSTDYLMNGSITKTTTGYAIQMQITKTSDKMTMASYSGTCTFAELDNLTGVRRASLDLLQKMGITPTERTKIELTGAGNKNHVDAQTALARGVTAQKNGTVVEAMGYFYNAVSFDPKLTEANRRLSTLSSNVSSGNIGENVRNDIQRRNEWLKILAECDDFFSKHLPYEIVYNPQLTLQGGTDYRSESVSLSFKMAVKTTGAFQVAQNILDGLKSTGKTMEWGLSDWPLSSPSFCDASVIYSPFEGDILWADKYPFDVSGNLNESWGISSLTVAESGRAIKVDVALINDHGKTIATSSRLFFQWIAMFQDKRKGIIVEGDVEKLMKRDWSAEMNIGGRGNISVTKGYINKMNQPIVFLNVNANDITDNLTIKIVSVNGIDAETAGRTGYIQITTGNVK